MESHGLGVIRGYVVDSSLLVSAEQRKNALRQTAGHVPVVISALTDYWGTAEIIARRRWRAGRNGAIRGAISSLWNLPAVRLPNPGF
jgi:hypothetical protein